MIAVVASQAQIVLIGAAATRDRDAMVELDLIVQQVFRAMLASVVISTHNPNLGLEGDVSA